MIPLIDSHCHLDFEQFDHDRQSIINRCQALAINTIIVPGVVADNWPKLLKLCQHYKVLQPALGLHPLFMEQHQAVHIEQLKNMVAHHSLIAIGEIGLDFYQTKDNSEQQIDLFKQQLSIAQHAQLPVLLHIRKAHDKTLQILKQQPVKGGIVHAFNGSLQQAEHYIKLGFLLGVGGVITHIKATRMRALFSQLPLSSIVLETDAPDMPLANMQTDYNSPENIPLILSALASIRSESESEIAQQTSQNCQQLFNL